MVMSAPKHFPEKWTPVFRRKCDEATASAPSATLEAQGALASRRNRLCLLSIAAGLFLAPIGTPAFGALECRPEPALNRGGHWSWRNIDGKRCWYPGQPGMAKANLRWAQSSPPTLARGDDEAPASRVAARRNAGMPEPASAGNDQALLESYWPALETVPFNERWPR
jgi:hypothetical protein